MDAKYMIERLRALMSWRRNLEKLYRAVKAVVPDAKVYIFGGAAENRLTAVSDIDVLVVTRNPPKDAIEYGKVAARIKEELEKQGMEMSYLYEIHVVDKERARKYLARAKKVIDVEEEVRNT